MTPIRFYLNTWSFVVVLRSSGNYTAYQLDLIITALPVVVRKGVLIESTFHPKKKYFNDSE